MTNELKPCPFCGGENVTHCYDENDYTPTEFMVVCESCVFDGPPAKTKEDAVILWNTRSLSAALDIVITEVEQLSDPLIDDLEVWDDGASAYHDAVAAYKEMKLKIYETKGIEPSSNALKAAPARWLKPTFVAMLRSLKDK